MQKTTLLTPKRAVTGQKLLPPVNPSTQMHGNSLTPRSNGSRNH